MENNMAAAMAADGAATPALTPEKLTRLSKLVNQMADKADEIDEMGDKLKTLNEEYRALSGGQIPDLFDEMGLSQIKLTDGRSVEIKRTFAASITKEKQTGCFKWLRANGHESLITHELITKLKKGESKEQKKLIEVLAKLGLTYADKEKVHPQTLKAFVKEQIEKGGNFPQEQFSVFPIRETKVK